MNDTEHRQSADLSDFSEFSESRPLPDSIISCFRDGLLLAVRRIRSP